MPRRVRLLVVTHSLSGGGAERFAATLLSHLDRERFEPFACLAKDLRSYEVPADVPVTVLGYRGLLDLPRTVRRLRRAITEARPEVVLSNVLSTNCLAAAALRGLAARPPWVARVGNDPERGDPLLQRLWARRAYPRAEVLVCNSRGLAEALPRRYPAVAGRVRAIANPTDFEALDRLAAGEPEPVDQGGSRAEGSVRSDSAPEAPKGARGSAAGSATLLWMGRLTRQKRPDLALEVLARVRRRIDARLWLCGDGPLAAALDGQIEAQGLGGAAERLGFVANPFPLLRRADLFLLTSDFEGLPNALIEAQCLGLPAVATRCPYGPDEIVEDGVTGLLAPPGDVGALAAAVLDLLADGERRRTMGERAAERARQLFDRDRLVGEWEGLLLEVAMGTDPGHDGREPVPQG